MTSREKILARLSQSMDTPASKPKIGFEPTGYPDLFDAFVASLTAAGGEAVIVDNPEELDALIQNSFDNIENVIDTRCNNAVDLEAMDRCDLAILQGVFGVAENGAVWIDPQERYPRALLTLAGNLAIVMDRSAIVSTMHEAYSRIDFDEISYALFLSGPSKTADIEQALVIGAHGAIGLKVFLIQNQKELSA